LKCIRCRCCRNETYLPHLHECYVAGLDAFYVHLEGARGTSEAASEEGGSGEQIARETNGSIQGVLDMDMCMYIQRVNTDR
jgi:hypothetical protein